MPIFELFIVRFFAGYNRSKCYAPPPCERCGKSPAVQRGLCPACIERDEAPVLFI
jgi:hypothetical protein